ncbi:MAG: helix-turn-helix transcriptional regulator [Bacteroidetes bacterium]|nr:helix-turn-helix transcriptional regulator [Bacteroidota bacterium]MBT6684780.1 helix-turn-helix transcriptional regulator [Bacteroidota bacterium]MBT7141814.1 helix-turn-helix transcriptional regulator [Bacteroidota bacterium]MBT7490763.1 helix-turn-helix transcriptional regulator [Bacteroidota bacterium]
MNKLIIIEPSEIIFTGLSKLIDSRKFNISQVSSFDDFILKTNKLQTDLIIINPIFILNSVKTFKKVQIEFQHIKWFALIYNYFDESLLNKFDEKIYINDDTFSLNSKINNQIKINKANTAKAIDTISDRETEILKLIVEGNSNKEIADKLFLSTHTVMTHRKNITHKTGIKSVSGLTIYAVVNKIITIPDFKT